MEEKERYSWFNHSTEEIYDNKENIVFVGAITVLNQQNRRIWELVEENKQLKKQLEIFKISNDALQQDNLDLSYDKLDTAYEYAKEMAENWEKDYQEEIQQLKQQLLTFGRRISDQNEEILELNQQLHDLPKKIVEDIEKNFKG